MCWFGQRYHEIPLHPLHYVRADLHQGREDQGQHGHGEAQHVEKRNGSKCLLCIQDVVLIHQHIDSKAGQGDLGQTAGKATISVVVCSPARYAPLRPQQCLPAGDLFLSCFPSPLVPVSPLCWDPFPPQLFFEQPGTYSASQASVSQPLPRCRSTPAKVPNLSHPL